MSELNSISRHKERAYSAPTKVSRSSTFSNVQRLTKSEPKNIQNLEYTRPIYVVGQNYKIKPGSTIDDDEDFRKPTQQYILSILAKYHLNNPELPGPFIFTENASDPSIYNLPSELEFIKESRELAKIGILVNLIHLICLSIKSKWKQEQYIHNIGNFDLELQNKYDYKNENIKNFLEEYVNQMTDQSRAFRPGTSKYINAIASSLNETGEKYKKRILKDIKTLLKESSIEEFVKPHSKYIKEHLDNLNKACTDATYKVKTDDNLALLRDYSLFLEMEKYNAVPLDCPFIIIVGNLRLKNWRNLLKHYKNVKFVKY